MVGEIRSSVTRSSLRLLVFLLASAFVSSLRFGDSETAPRRSQQGRHLRQSVSKVKSEAKELFDGSRGWKTVGDDVVEVTADNSVDKLDMTLHNLPPAPYVLVDKILNGSWAYKVGIKTGMEILKLNGKDAKTMSREDFTADMRARPLTISFKKVDPNPDDLQAKLKKNFESAVTSGRIAGAEAGKAAAQQLIDELKKVLSSTPGPTAVAQLGAPSQPGAPQPGLPPQPGAASQQPGAVANAPPQGVLPPGVPQLPGMPLAPGMPGAAPSPSAWQPINPFNQATGAAAAAAAAAGIAPPPFAAANAPCKEKAGQPPDPVPPSPLDALKAAMAIRANVSATEGPILSPDVLDAVARLAKGRLGPFVPGSAPPSAAPVAPPIVVPPVQCTPQPCPQPQAPPPAPAALPVATAKIEFILTIQQISFTALKASPTLYHEAVTIVRETVAQAAGSGVKPSDVTVTLKAGSVVITAQVAPPPGADPAAIANNLERSAAAIVQRLLDQISALTAIQSVALGNITASAPTVKVLQDLATTTTTTPPDMRTLPKPPACQAPPPKLTKGDVAMALAPFKPAGAKGKAVKMNDGGSAWPLSDGGWAFQYPDMAVRMAEDGSTRIVWAKPAYAVEYDDSGISYHVGRNVVHRDTNGDLTYQQPTGTMHQEGSTLVYHWCNPNVIVYQTPNGFVYYDDLGMTYRSMGKDVTHYTWNGEVLYQGAGGVTRQSADGTVTHWTDAGAVFRHNDGSVTYTATGERASKPLAMGDLGPDPFPGPELTAQDVMTLSVPAPLAMGPAPAPAPAAPPAAVPPAILATSAAPTLMPFGSR